MIRAADLVDGFEESYEDGTGYIWGEVWTMWSDAEQAAYVRKYANDPRRATSVEFGGKWAGHYVTDCSGLFTHWFQILGGRMYHGSNTMYREWCTAKGQLKNGKRTDGRPLRPGTAVFTGDESNHGHVGLYVGGGWVIEAEGTKAGVIRSKVTKSKWTYWGELKGVDYGSVPDAPDDPAPADDRPTLRKGSKGEYVTLLQTMLINRGYDVGSTGADGIFGNATEKAVKSFQKAVGLVDDGIVGKRTWAALDGQSGGETRYSVTISGLTGDEAKKLEEQFPGQTVTKKE